MTCLDDLLRLARSDDADQVLWKVDEAFAGMGELSPRAAALHELVRFCQFDEIEPWLLEQPDGLRRVQRFAKAHGLDRMAAILDDSLAGRVQPACAALITGNGYVAVPIDTPAPDDCCMVSVSEAGWEATEVAVLVELSGFAAAVLRELQATHGDLLIETPPRIRNRDAARAETRRVLAGASAASLLRRLLDGRHPRMAAAEHEDARERRLDRATMLPVRHEAGNAVAPDQLAALRRRHGEAIDELLSMYAQHDGVQLFIADGEPGFVFAPVSEWDELGREAIEWLEIQFGDVNEIPVHVRSAVAFGRIPGDAATWLLLTEGEHAGKITVADSDALIDDEPRFESIAELLAALLVDTWRVLRGGHVRYGDLFPVRYHTD